MSRYRLTPNGNPTVIFGGQVSTVGTSPASGGQSDGSDASYVESLVAGGSRVQVRMPLSTKSIPASEQVVAAKSRMRFWNGNCRAWPAKAASPSYSVSAGAIASGARGGAWLDVTSGDGGCSLSQADVDGLLITWENTSSYGAIARLSESWVELVTASVPRTPASIAVTSGTTRPVVSWVHTDRVERTVITRARSGYTRTLTTSIAHGFTVGQAVTVAINHPDYDGVWQITAVTSTTLEYEIGISGTEMPTSASGSVWTGDDKPQFQARVKVFSQSQYSASGFDPDAVEPVWTTLVIDGSQSAQVGAVLQVGGTYRAYVRTSSEAYYTVLTSEYGYAQFTVSVSVPAAPTLSAALQPDGHVRLGWQVGALSPAGFGDPRQALIERSTDGVTWTRCWVRPGAADAGWGLLAEGEDGEHGIITWDFTQVVLRDYEAPRGGLVQYRARTIYLGTAGLLPSDAATATVDVPNGGDYVLRSMLDPTVVCRPRVLASSPPKWEQTEAQAVYRPVGRTAAVVVTGDLYAPDASYTFGCADAAELEALQAVLALQDRVLLQEPFTDSAGWGRQAYLRAGERRTWSIDTNAHPDAPWTTVTVPFTGVGPGVGV